METPTENEISQMEILIKIADKLYEINNHLTEIDSKLSDLISQRRPKEESPVSKVERWTNNLRRK